MLDIIQVTLQTSKLNEMKLFYENILGFNVLEAHHNQFTFKAGLTTIVFCDEHVQNNPFYHFAFDIPSNQFTEAKQWIKKKVSLLIEDDADEVYFEGIHAKSIYFEDPAGNIVEFIARLEDNPASSTPFSIKSVIKLSEMSLVVDDKLHVAQQLSKVGLLERDKQQVLVNSLSFIGTREHPVYLLLVDPNRRWFFSNQLATVYPLDILFDSGIQLTIDNNHQFHVKQL